MNLRPLDPRAIRTGAQSGKMPSLTWAYGPDCPPSPSKVAAIRPITRNRSSSEWGGARLAEAYDLRRACASFPLASGALPWAVTKTPGHSRIGLIMSTYTHVLLDIKGDVSRHE